MDDVTSSGIATADATPISLYLDLEKGHIADIEVVARTALAWSAAIKEIAYIVDPSIEVRVELASGTEGSLSLNSWIKKIRGTAGIRSDLRTIAISVAAWFALQTASYTYQAILDYLRGDDAPLETRQMTEKELAQLATQIVDRLNANIARQQRQVIYRELERETAVKGVGVSLRLGVRPTYIVPRREFPLTTGSIVEEPATAKRKSITRMNVVVISPTLKGTPRSWRFQYSNLPEFGATMKDQAFLKAIEDGRIAIPLRAGTEMEVEIEAKEENEGGVWVVKERAITRVFQPEISRSGELPLEGPFERQQSKDNHQSDETDGPG
jgi:hypothetical protein